MSVLETMPPREDQGAMVAAMPQASDKDGLPPPAPIISETGAFAAVIVLGLLAFAIFARRRLAWCAARIASKFAAIMRWLRMNEPDQI